MGDLVFLVKMPLSHQLRMISRVHGHGIYVSVTEKKFDMFKAVASLDTYQITKCSDSKKKILFYLIFKKFKREFSDQQFLDKNIIISKTWTIQNSAFRKIMAFIQIVQRQRG